MELINGLSVAVLGTTFFAAAIPKLRNPKGFILIVVNYSLLPENAAHQVGRALPPLELFLALMLLSGTSVRLASVTAALLLLSFMVGISVNLYRGHDFDCGCFGRGHRGLSSRQLLLRDLGLVVVSIVAAYTAAGGVLSVEPWAPGSAGVLANVFVRIGSCMVASALLAVALRMSGRQRRAEESIPAIGSERGVAVHGRTQVGRAP